MRSTILFIPATLAVWSLAGCWLTPYEFGRRMDGLERHLARVQSVDGTRVYVGEISFANAIVESEVRVAQFIGVDGSGRATSLATPCDGILASMQATAGNEPGNRSTPAEPDIRAMARQLLDPQGTTPTLAPDWIRVGLFANTFQMRLSAGGPAFNVSAQGSQTGFSFQAWRAGTWNRANVGPLMAQLFTCCQLQGCGEYVVVGERTLTRHLVSFNNVQLSADGSYTIYRGQGTSAVSTGSMSRQAWHELDLVKVPNRVRDLRDVCSIPAFVHIERADPSVISFHCPLTTLTASGENVTVDQQNSTADRFSFRVRTSSPAGTVGQVILTAQAFEVRIPVVVLASGQSANVPPAGSPPLIPP